MTADRPCPSRATVAALLLGTLPSHQEEEVNAHIDSCVACAVVAYQFAFRWRRVGLPVGALDGRILLIFGAATVFFAALLKGVFDSGVSGAS